MEDNSFGQGFFELPGLLSGLGRYVENLKPSKLVDYKVFPNEGIWMLTTKNDTRMSIMAEDIKPLLRLGLLRIQCNTPGTLSFYFQGSPVSYDRR